MGERVLRSWHVQLFIIFAIAVPKFERSTPVKKKDVDVFVDADLDMDMYIEMDMDMD